MAMLPSRTLAGEDSGVSERVCLCPRSSGVRGVTLPPNTNREDRWRRMVLGRGSDEGSCDDCDCDDVRDAGSVPGGERGDLALVVNLFANFMNGVMDLERALAATVALLA